MACVGLHRLARSFYSPRPLLPSTPIFIVFHCMLNDCDYIVPCLLLLSIRSLFHVSFLSHIPLSPLFPPELFPCNRILSSSLSLSSLVSLVSPHPSLSPNPHLGWMSKLHRDRCRAWNNRRRPRCHVDRPNSPNGVEIPSSSSSPHEETRESCVQLPDEINRRHARVASVEHSCGAGVVLPPLERYIVLAEANDRRDDAHLVARSL